MIEVKPNVLDAWECCCGNPAHRKHSEENCWTATDSDYPGFESSSTASPERARQNLVDVIERFGHEAKRAAG